MLRRLRRKFAYHFPERRVFIRTDDETRFLRLSAAHQFSMIVGMALLVGWSVLAAALLFIDSIGAGNFREQAIRDQQIYQSRLNTLSQERDVRLNEATAAQKRFALALDQLGTMQEELLHSETRREELERAITIMQSKLASALKTKRDVTQELELAKGGVIGAQKTPSNEALIRTLYKTIEELSNERDTFDANAQEAEALLEQTELQLALMEERNMEIFGSIEDALTVSMEPLDRMFRNAGMNPDDVLNTVKRGYSGFGGPELPRTLSRDSPDAADYLRAQLIVEKLDRVNMYRIAAESIPFGHPVTAPHRFSSGYGMRNGRPHRGADFAAPVGTPILAGADGVVTYAGWLSSYGKLIKIRHSNGYETRYAHLNKIRVKVGQRVSRGQRIGDMGNTGRSTGPHLHYEVRKNGNAVNPMKFIKAGKNVF